MRYGYWLPVFGGWLRNVDDEQMQATWDYNRRLAQRSEELGYDLTLIAELNLNDIKGVDAPSLDAWSTAAALAAGTERLGVIGGLGPTFPPPPRLGKKAANRQWVVERAGVLLRGPVLLDSGCRARAQAASTAAADDLRRWRIACRQ